MKILFLDDDLNRHSKFRQNCCGHDVTYVYTAAEAIEAIDKEQFHIIYLDHDLDGVFTDPGPTTGYAVAQHLCTIPKERLPLGVIVHSYNFPAADKMMEILLAAGVRSIRRMWDTGGIDFFTELRQGQNSVEESGNMN